MKSKVLIHSICIGLLLLGPFLPGTVRAAPDTVYIGTYITSVHNIDFKAREYTISFWLWLNYKNKRLNFQKYLEIPNAKSHCYEFLNVDSSHDRIYMLMKVQCVMKDSWRTEDFPFDKQRLWLTIESSQYDMDSLVFVVDSCGEKYDQKIKYGMAGWKVDTCLVKIDTSVYKTKFGDEDINDPVGIYSAYKVRIKILRTSSWLMFLKLFIGMYIAFLIAYICFYIRPENYDSRFQLSVGALFATIGNKYIIESSLPDANSFTLVDSLHGLTLFFIMLTIALTIFSLRIGSRNEQYRTSTFDMISAQTLLALYIISNIIFISIAESHYHS